MHHHRIVLAGFVGKNTKKKEKLRSLSIFFVAMNVFF